MSFFIVIIIGISLSMDAFSLALAYGTHYITNKQINMLSVIVGLYHFIMPLLGLLVGKKIINLLPIKTNVLVFIILFLIGVEMIVESIKNEVVIRKINFMEMLVFGFAVSIDSFSLGISLKTIYNDYYLSVITFSICSFLFTFLGLKLGKYINRSVGPLSTLIGGIVLIIIGLFYLV